MTHETRTPETVGIRYVEAGPIHYCSPASLLLGQGDYVIVATDRGERLGWVVLTPDQVGNARFEGPIRVVDRLASIEEVERHRELKRRAEADVLRAQAVVSRLDQRVRVASLTYDLTARFAELTYTAREGSNLDDRLEREVARDLQIEDLSVEQVGDRDRAKALGGLGQCGRGLCCSTWMTEFPAISIKMAKDQGLAPNPSKISGVCGRLLCCLSFEVDDYRAIVGSLPKVGKNLTTPVGKAKVLNINALTEMVRLRFEQTGQVIEISTEAVKRQMGTTLRPEELDAEIEEALREKDRRRTENLVAVLAPIDRPLRDTSDADAPEVDEEERTRRRTERNERSERTERSERGPRTGGSRRPSAPTGGTSEAPARRRRPSRSGASPEGSAPASPTGESRSGIRITRRRAGEPTPDGAGAAEGTRTRRRRRGSGGGGGGAPNSTGPTGSSPTGGAQLGGTGNTSPTARIGGIRGAEGAGDVASGVPADEGTTAGRRRRRGRRGGRRRGGGEGGEGGSTTTPTSPTTE